MDTLVEEYTRIAPGILNTVALELHHRFSAACTRVRVSWLLLVLVAVALLGTPLTQHLWTWDNFLQGGQDFETAIFLILISFCLLAVLARSTWADLKQVFAPLGCRASSSSVSHSDAHPDSHSASLAPSRPVSSSSASAARLPQAFNFPLQI